jgi:hypothetical protein
MCSFLAYYEGIKTSYATAPRLTVQVVIIMCYNNAIAPRLNALN